MLPDVALMGPWQIAGVMDPQDVAALMREGAAPLSSEIVIEDRLLVGAEARQHDAAGDALSAQVWENLPEMLQEPLAAALDTRSGKLLYVPPEASSRRPLLAVEIDYATKKPKRQLNMIVAAYRPKLNDVLGEIRGGLVKAGRPSIHR